MPGAFPEPPPLGESRPFVELMHRLTPGGVEPRATGPRPGSIESRLAEAPLEAFHDERSRRVSRRRGARPGASRERGMRGLFSRAFRRAEPSPGAHLFHLREIQRDDGLSVELEFYAGDVLAVHNEVLLVSAFAGSYQPTPGSIFGAIADRYGISFASGPPADATRYPEGLLHFPVSCPAFDSLWVIELRDPRRPFSLEDLRGALDAVGGRLPDMLASASSITLPLLGTGNQQLNPRDVARELLSALPRWARESAAAHGPGLHARARARGRAEPRPRRSRVQRGQLGAAVGVPGAAAPARARVLERAGSRGAQGSPADRERAGSLDAEHRARGTADRGGRAPGRPARERKTKTAERQRADLAAPHLQLLLAHGRSAAAGETIVSDDAVMVLYAAMRVAEMTERLHTSGSKTCDELARGLQSIGRSNHRGSHHRWLARRRSWHQEEEDDPQGGPQEDAGATDRQGRDLPVSSRIYRRT